MARGHATSRPYSAHIDGIVLSGMVMDVRRNFGIETPSSKARQSLAQVLLLVRVATSPTSVAGQKVSLDASPTFTARDNSSMFAVA